MLHTHILPYLSIIHPDSVLSKLAFAPLKVYQPIPIELDLAEPKEVRVDTMLANKYPFFNVKVHVGG